jgi:hypothetical protein
MSHVTKTGLLLILPLPVCIVIAIIMQYHPLPLLAGEDFKGISILDELFIFVALLSIPLFLFGASVLAAQFIRTRRNARPPSV